MSAVRTERLLNLLTLLLNTRRPISLRELRDMPEFAAYRTKDKNSGDRAFERDKADLVELGVPVHWTPPEQDDDEEGFGGYLIEPDKYYLPELELSPGQLALLSIAGAAAATIEGFPGRAAVLRALNKLGFEVEGEAELRTALLAHAPIQAGDDPSRVGDHLRKLHDAVARRRRMRMTYHGVRAQSSTDRDVDPYGLYYQQGVWYIVGHCHLRNALRTFHLGRIEKVAFKGTGQVRGPDFEVPEGFEIKDHLRKRPWAFPGGPPCDVVIRLAERLVPAIPELFGAEVSVERSDRGTLVHLRVTHRSALIATVLPHGAAAEVLEPLDLRRQIGQIYAELADRYGSSMAADGMTTDARG